jgi:hypothetical protein
MSPATSGYEKQPAISLHKRSELKQASRINPDERSDIGIRKAASHFIAQAKRTETGKSN